MKRKLHILGAVFGLGFLASMTWVGITHATDVRAGDKPILASNETTNNSLYTAGNSVVVAGTVKGDLFCAGSNLDITGTVEGDVICAGQSVRVAGRVLGDVRVAGQNVEITAEVAGSVTVMGESVVLGPEAKVGRDVTLGAARAHLEGVIGRDVLGGAESIVLAGKVARNFDAEVTALTLDSSAAIGGDFNYRSVSPAQIAQGATVSGTTHYTERTSDGSESRAAALFWGTLYGFIAMAVLGLAALLLAPRSMDALAVTARSRIAASFAAGAAVLIVTPIAVVLLFMTLFGIPLAMVLLLLWVAGLIASFAVGAYAIGWITVEKLGWPNRGRRAMSLFIGMLIMALVGLVPVVGGIMVFLLMLCGLGAMTLVVARRLWPKKTVKAKS